MSGEHFDLELQDLLDGRLGPEEETRVLAHVRECERCRGVLEDLRRGRELARGLEAIAVPRELRDRLIVALDGAIPSEARSPLSRRAFLAASGVAAAAAIAGVVYRFRTRDWPQEAIDTFHEYQSGSRPLDIVEAKPSDLETFFGARLPFHTKVFDLGMMSYRLLGGRIERVGGRPAAMYVYNGPEQRRLLCEMFTGSVADLPRPSERRERGGVTLFIYQRSPYTAVFWAEADILCVLVSDMNAEDTIALAFAKATKT
jgi:anti-sigma factor RsiW